MTGMKDVRLLAAVTAAALVLPAAGASSADHPTPGVGQGVAGARYATDAYPGFDNDDEVVKPERKTPRWFAFINGPKCGSAAEQLAYCAGLEAEESYSKAAKQLDALVREWPTAPEAVKAQQRLAEIRMERLQDYEEAFKDYRYLMDFYSAQCDYGATADMLYKLAGILKIEGKEVMFVRFANTVDVRRAYESCVLRAPGAKWAPDAMLTIASLREDEGKYDKAVEVYENLCSIHPDSEQAKTAVAREAAARMVILHDREYNRYRCRDTIDFMRMALRKCRPDDAEKIQGYLDEASALLEDEAYRGAKFYDSKTRTKRSAINAYERFLAEHPRSEHADEVRARVEELKGAEK